MKTIKSKIIPFALSFCIVMLAVVALAPPAFAAATVTIGGNAIAAGKTYTYTAANQHAGEQSYNPAAANSVSLNASGDTLTLNNATIASTVGITGGDITIAVNGTSTITDTTPADQALYVTNHLTFTGSGSLTVNGFNSTSNSDHPSVAINCIGTITFNGPTITANGGSRMSDSGNGGDTGVIAGGIIVNSGVVKLKGGDTNIAAGIGGYGLFLLGTATINGGDVDILGGNGVGGGASGGNGIFGGSVSITGGDVYIKGGDATYVSAFGGKGAYSSFTISGGTSVTIIGGNGRHHDGDHAVNGDVVISTTTTPITITGGNSISGANPGQIGNGSHGVHGNVTTPTGTIGPGTNITITGGTGGLSNGQAYTGTLSQGGALIPTPAPQPSSGNSGGDVLYSLARAQTASGVYTFTSNGAHSAFSGVWINGAAIPPSYYTAVKNANGTVSITFTNSYAAALNYSEEYLIHFIFNDGLGITNFFKDAAASAPLAEEAPDSSAPAFEPASEPEPTSQPEAEPASQPEAGPTSQPTSQPEASSTTEPMAEEQSGSLMIPIIVILLIVCAGGGVLLFFKVRKNKK